MFDSFIMWVRVQGSPCHIAAGSHPVQEAGGQIPKLLQSCQKPSSLTMKLFMVKLDGF